MKLLTRYLFKDILHYFWIFITIFVVVLMVNEIYDTREQFIRYNASMGDIILFLLCGIPGQLAQMLPMICLMSTIFSYGLLAKNREILAMVSVGLSFRALAIPALVFGLGMTAFMFWFTESVVPASQSKAQYLVNVKIKGKSESIFTKRNNLFVKGKGNRFYIIQNYFSDKKEMAFPTILIANQDGSGIAERIEADSGKLVPGVGVSYWEFRGAEHWLFNPDGSLGKYEKYSGPYRLEMEDNLDRFLTKSKKPDMMNFHELNEYIALLRQKGDKDIYSYSTWLQLKLAFPVACLLMALLGFAVVADVNARRFARGVSLGLLIAIGYYLINGFMKNMGQSGMISPSVAGWLPVIVFAFMVFRLMARMNKIRG